MRARWLLTALIGVSCGAETDPAQIQAALEESQKVAGERETKLRELEGRLRASEFEKAILTKRLTELESGPGTSPGPAAPGVPWTMRSGTTVGGGGPAGKPRTSLDPPDPIANPPMSTLGNPELREAWRARSHSTGERRELREQREAP
jgi:hypothetical protein